MNKIDELNILHSRKNEIDQTLGDNVGGLKHNTPNFNFKFKYVGPSDFGIDIQIHNGTNSLYLATSDVESLYGFLKNIFDEPKENFYVKPTKKIKEDLKTNN